MSITATNTQLKHALISEVIPTNTSVAIILEYMRDFTFSEINTYATQWLAGRVTKRDAVAYRELFLLFVPAFTE